MNEALDYIASYFENGLTAQERMQFEQRITTDAAFAGEVAFYLQAKQALRQELLQQKEKSWQAAPEVSETKPAPVVAMKRPSLVRRLIAVAAVVVILIGLSLVFLLKEGGATQMAQQYSDSAFETLSLSMGSQDSIEQGLDAYNGGRYNEADTIFTRLYATHPDKLKALEYAGIVSLKMKDYDKAVQRFTELSGHQKMFANPGTFYKAITLLARNKSGDKEQARSLLKQVVASEDSEYKEKARQLLSEF